MTLILARLVIGPRFSSRPARIAAATAGAEPRRPSGTNGVSQISRAKRTAWLATPIHESISRAPGIATAAGA
jgi:hypothetical protein